MTSRLPSSLRKLMVTQKSTKFREATNIVTVPMQQMQGEMGPTDVLIKNRFVGVNASDINQTSGRYDPTAKLPYSCGMEGVGEVVAAGPQCKKASVGQPMAYSAINFGAYADYTVVPERFAFPIPSIRPEYVSLPVSGLTAALALDKVGEMKPGEKVLITAAAGGTGQFAVQLAKNRGCHVIGTCSTDEKMELLKKLGCDRPINYKKEDLKAVLRKEYPKGVDVIYESVGGETFDTVVKCLATKGRLIVIGFITGYQSSIGISPLKTPALPAMLLTKSASLRGFFLFHYMRDFDEYFEKLDAMIKEGTLQTPYDQGKNSPLGPFKGIDSIADAVEYLYTQKSVGKIIVELGQPTSQL